MRSTMRHTFGICAVSTVLTLSVSAAAQPPPDSNTAGIADTPAQARDPIRRSEVIEEISGNLVLGAGAFDTGPVDDRLQAMDYGDVDALAVMAGLSGRIIFDFGLMAGVAGGIAGPEATAGPEDYDAQLSYRMFRGEAGYALLHSERWLLLPKLGLGGYSVELLVEEDSDATFDELVGAPGNTTRLSSGGMLMSAVLEFDVRFPLGQPSSHPRYFLSVGLEGGYFYSVPFGVWRSSAGSEVDDGPDADLTGGFAALTFGGGGFGI